jgi:hypothetical protein
LPREPQWQASLAGGVLRDLSDYGTVLRILRPHFASRKILEEVPFGERVAVNDE